MAQKDAAGIALVVWVMCFGAALYQGAEACTNLIVTPGASVDGSSIYAYSADSAALYGTLDRLPGMSNISPGTTKKIWDWDSGVLLGEIEEVEETFDVVGNMNEHQLTIGETTFGGVEELTQGQDGAIMDYGSLIWTTLQRAKTVPEAITVMADLVDRYGYASEGESFTLTDPRECWVLEMIGKGQGERGAVWMAVRIPDGHVAAHANQARMPFVDMENADPTTARWSSDVVTFAGLFCCYARPLCEHSRSFLTLQCLGCWQLPRSCSILLQACLSSSPMSTIRSRSVVHAAAKRECGASFQR
jgi:hypothetical protein